MSLWRWTKIIAVGAGVMVGGPMLVEYVRPTEEELRSRYNPELRARSLEGREQREQDFDDFLSKLKSAAKSDKPIWTVLSEMEKEEKKRAAKRRESEDAEAQAQRDEMRKQAGLEPQDSGQRKS